jgi:uncharacterized membrane protein YkoI
MNDFNGGSLTRLTAVTFAFVSALATTLGVLADDVDIAEAIDVAQMIAPAGVPVQIQDERLTNEEVTYEVRFVLNNGRKTADVEINPRTGDELQYDEARQSAQERGAWQEMLALIESAQVTFADAIDEARESYPEAAIVQVQLDVELGVLEYDITLEDHIGTFQIEIDAVTGSVSDAPRPRALIADVAAAARADTAGGTLLSIDFDEGGADPAYVALLAKRRGRKEVTVEIDEVTAAVLASSTRTTPASLRADYREQMDGLADATIDFDQAVALALAYAGNGRPMWIDVDLRNNRVSYRCGIDLGMVQVTVWVDAVTAQVWRRR